MFFRKNPHMLQLFIASTDWHESWNFSYINRYCTVEVKSKFPLRVLLKETVAQTCTKLEQLNIDLGLLFTRNLNALYAMIFVVLRWFYKLYCCIEVWDEIPLWLLSCLQSLTKKVAEKKIIEGQIVPCGWAGCHSSTGIAETEELFWLPACRVFQEKSLWVSDGCWVKNVKL